MSSSDRLLLILHVGFVIFTLGPLTAATMATPRYIRRRDVGVLRYLTRITRIYGLGTLGILLFGLFLTKGDLSEFWLSASTTLFVVALVLLVLIERDQRRATHALQLAAASQTALARPADSAESAPAVPAEAEAAEAKPVNATPDEETKEENGAPPAKAEEIARVERGRIASFSGVVALIWLVILFLMIWYGRS
jgi:Ca2+/Na+ antiporter